MKPCGPRAEFSTIDFEADELYLKRLGDTLLKKILKKLGETVSTKLSNWLAVREFPIDGNRSLDRLLKMDL